MSKFFMTTEEKIVAKALELFNERGIEYVGLRELAAVLGIRVGNITYYFPTKDDLVARLSADLAVLNSRITTDHLSIYSLLQRFANVFGNHVQYRCLLLSFVHLIEQNKALSEAYKATQDLRYKSLREDLSLLQKTGYLTPETEVEFVLSMITLLVRFWISEASISFRHLSPPEQISHYASLLANFLIPYATPKGKEDIQRFLDDL
ncbi:TetR/AcrR family transcriptional regulator [Larkinella rosea]|uniref:TetR/AcrR family transcriptional regulator n=1 Tax=Larkinella rosea TaxID=2025312 RepID=A0A3P1BJM5_9BACT|nr:TetR/AcrR family transcriptional regulator [Larkinella rosea]RRB01116.1 TetR/AcrR family transcriptional regulator [Larkinella rosea]